MDASTAKKVSTTAEMVPTPSEKVPTPSEKVPITPKTVPLLEYKPYELNPAVGPPGKLTSGSKLYRWNRRVEGIQTVYVSICLDACEAL